MDNNTLGLPLLQRSAIHLFLLVAVSLFTFMLGRLSRPAQCLAEEKVLLSSILPANLVASKTPAPFYTTLDASELGAKALSMQPVTDKISVHTYEGMYSSYFEANSARRYQKLKILEIGLGCNMNYGPGASAKLWKEYFPNSEVWFAEYDAKCVSSHQANLTRLGIQVVTGDQSDIPTLHKWINQTGGNFDVIIDDGGHANHQIYNSFHLLFFNALKPGGAYFIEDLQVSRWPAWRGTGPIMIDVVRDWIESMLRPITVQGALRDLESKHHQMVDFQSPPQRHRLPVGAKAVHCIAEMCVVLKCTEEDRRCPLGAPL